MLVCMNTVGPLERSLGTRAGGYVARCRQRACVGERVEGHPFSLDPGHLFFLPMGYKDLHPFRDIKSVAQNAAEHRPARRPSFLGIGVGRPQAFAPRAALLVALHTHTESWYPHILTSWGVSRRHHITQYSSTQRQGNGARPMPLSRDRTFSLLLLLRCLLYTSPSPRDRQKSRMPSSA